MIIMSEIENLLTEKQKEIIVEVFRQIYGNDLEYNFVDNDLEIIDGDFNLIGVVENKPLSLYLDLVLQQVYMGIIASLTNPSNEKDDNIYSINLYNYVSTMKLDNESLQILQILITLHLENFASNLINNVETVNVKINDDDIINIYIKVRTITGGILDFIVNYFR